MAVTEPGEEQRRRRRRRWVAAGVAGLLLPNAFAAAHAWALTHYVQGGERPRPPQELTAGERLQRLLLGVRVPRPENGARFLESCYGRLTDTVRARVRLMGAPASPGAELLVLWGSLLGGFNGFGLDPVEDAASAMGVPSLVLHGDADPTVPVEAARELADALGARLVLFPGAGHVSLVGAAPDAWEAATTALLDEVAPR